MQFILHDGVGMSHSSTMAVATGPGVQLDALRAILLTAHELAVELAIDPLGERILKAFSDLPEADREPILKIVERDAAWCSIVAQTASETGITVRPNPHASLYVHVFDQVPQGEGGPLRRDIDVIRFGIERFVQLLPLFFQEGVREQWMTAARELVREVDPELTGYAERLAHEVLALVAESRAARGGSSAA